MLRGGPVFSSTEPAAGGVQRAGGGQLLVRLSLTWLVTQSAWIESQEGTCSWPSGSVRCTPRAELQAGPAPVAAPRGQDVQPAVLRQRRGQPSWVHVRQMLAASQRPAAGGGSRGPAPSGHWCCWGCKSVGCCADLESCQRRCPGDKASRGRPAFCRLTAEAALLGAGGERVCSRGTGGRHHLAAAPAPRAAGAAVACGALQEARGQALLRAREQARGE